jgi:hypothetical protein
VDITARCVLDDDAGTVDVTQTLAIDDRSTPIGRRTIADGTRPGALVKSRHDRGWLVFRYEPGWLCVQRLVEDLGPLEDPPHEPV